MDVQKPDRPEKADKEHILDRGTARLCQVAQFGFWFIMVLSAIFSTFLLLFAILEGWHFLVSWYRAPHDNAGMATTLKVIEDLFLAPLPFIVGLTLYNWSLQLGSGAEAVSGEEGPPSERQSAGRNPLKSFVITKGLVIGLMISAVGVDLVELLLQHRDDLRHYLAGMGLMMVLAIFYALLQRESS